MEKQSSIEITPEAKRQIVLLKENDYTLQSECLRLSIKGKGCDGFTYQVGFDTPKSQDQVLIFENFFSDSKKFYILLDQLASFYIRNATLDYQFNEQGDGFVLKNHDQHLYEGKFFNSNDSLVPKF